MKAQIIQAVEIAGSQKALADLVGVSRRPVWAWIDRGTTSVLNTERQSKRPAVS